MDFDLSNLYYTHQQLHRNNRQVEDNENIDNEGEASIENDGNDVDGLSPNDLNAARRHFREFLSECLFR